MPNLLVQAVDRALLVDTIPSETQAAGNAWAARMLGVGSVVGFFVYVQTLTSRSSLDHVDAEETSTLLQYYRSLDTHSYKFYL